MISSKNKELFLITTADRRFWKTDSPVLFLGEWCKLYAYKEDLAKIPHEVLPYHWDDREKFRRDCAYLQDLYEKVLPELSQRLNELHGENHDVRYWRMIIGPWLFYFIQIIFDRYTSINQAISTGRISGTTIARYNPSDAVCVDYNDYAQMSLSDEGNQCIYSWIIEHTTDLNYEKIDAVPRKKLNSNGVSGQRSLKKIMKKMILMYEKNVSYRFNSIALVSSYLNLKDLFLLQWSLKQWPSLFFPDIPCPNMEANWTLRDQLSLSCAANSFEQCLSKIMKSQMPLLYLEGYQGMKQQVSKICGGRPKVILTANDFYGNEGFKFWAAQCVEHGTRFLGVQHGGHYGNGLCNPMEEHEIRISDCYYTWGWTSKTFPQTKPLAATKLNPYQGVPSNSSGKIALVLLTMPRYSYYLYSVCISSTGNLDYLEDQYAFVRGLSSSAQELLKVRLHPVDYQWDYLKRWKDLFSSLDYDVASQSFIQCLKESRLVIGTYNSTTYLESFTANIPTILFWNPAHWEIRDEAKPFFLQLKQAGILHDTPESAAQKVNEIFANPLQWWNQKEVQEAKDSFSKQFAHVSDQWLPQWKYELETQAKLAKNSL